MDAAVAPMMIDGRPRNGHNTVPAKQVILAWVSVAVDRTLW